MKWKLKTSSAPESFMQDDDTASSATPSAPLAEKQDTMQNTMPLSSDKSLEQQPDTTSPPTEPSDFPSGITLFALGLSIFLASLDMTIVATAIPRITDDFKGLDQVFWYGAAFFLTNGGFQSSWGKAYKYLPLKATFLTAVFVFELGSLLCAVAPGPTALIVGRAFNGLGAAGIGTGAYTILAFVAAPHKRALYTGVIGVANGVACVAGPLVSGIFADKVSWRWCFYVNLPFGSLAAAIIILGFHTPKGARPVSATWKEILLQMDLICAFIIVGAIVSYILALQYGGQTRPWDDAAVIGLLVCFLGLLLVVFCLWERYLQERAMVVPRLMGKRSVRVGTLFAFFFGGSYFLTIYYLPIYFQSVGGASPIMSGVMNLPLILSVTVSMVLSGALVGMTGHGALIEICGAGVGLIGAGLVLTLYVGSGPGRWITYQIVGGIGWGFAFQVLMIIAQGKATAEDLSSTTSLILLFQCLGGTVFVSAAQSAFVNLLHHLLTLTPDIDLADVLRTGAMDIRRAFSAQQVPGIVASYMAGLKAAFSIALAACAVALVVSVCNERGGAGKASRDEVVDGAFAGKR